MKTFALIAALPVALTLAACGESAVDGTDTTSMEPAAVEPMDQGMSDPMAAETPMTDDMMASDTMGEDGMMADDAMSGDEMADTPNATATPM